MLSNKRLYAYIAAFGFWIIIAIFFSFHVIPLNTRIVAIALLAFTVAIGATNIFRFSGWIAAVVSIIIYSLVEINLKGLRVDILNPIYYFSVGVLVTSGFAALFSHEIDDLFFSVENNQKLIDELRLYDPVTGLIRYKQALRLLKSEIIRCERYKRKVCLLLFQVENNGESLDPETAENFADLDRKMSGALMSSVRTSDIPFEGDGYGAVLTETDMDGVNIVANRLTNYVVDRIRVPIVIGVAQYPEDGKTEIELSRAAEAALEYALINKRSLVRFDQISESIPNGKFRNDKPSLVKKLKQET
jgi:GGDEF domain-containing protein